MNNLSIESHDFNMQKLLSDQKRYVVPLYQRPYEWQIGEVTVLLQDIFDSYNEGEPYFIGTMQLADGKNIVDGQQRITTILILLKELSLRFHENDDLKKFDFDRLETQVNSPNEQEKLKNYFSSRKSCEIMDGSNKYAVNGKIVCDWLNKLFESEDEDKPINPNKLIKHILEELIFVVIETKNANISKIIQIFKKHNTTGRPLAFEDVFKLKTYEYLKDKEGMEDKDALDKINEIYKYREDIFKETKKKWNLINERDFSMDTVLSNYQLVLIAKYKLPIQLIDYKKERFFDELFDVLSGKDISAFKNVKEQGLKSDNLKNDLKKLIRIIGDWEIVVNDGSRKKEDIFSYYIIGRGRYSKYIDLNSYGIIIPYLFFHEDKNFDEIYSILYELHKLFFIYSIYFRGDKSVIKTLMNNILLNINNPFNEIVNKIVDKKNVNEDIDREELKKDLGRNIAEDNSAMYKNLICRVSEFIKLNDKPDNFWQMFFSEDIDIEHIHANADDSLVWKDEELQNSIGNLTLLDSHTNRSIGANSFSEKKIGYQDAINKYHYPMIELLLKKDAWKEEDAKERRNEVIKEIIAYIYS